MGHIVDGYYQKLLIHSISNYLQATGILLVEDLIYSYIYNNFFFVAWHNYVNRSSFENLI